MSDMKEQSKGAPVGERALLEDTAVQSGDVR